MNDKRLINSEELSKRVSIPIWSIQKLTREKKIPAYSINGRTFLYDPEEVISAIKKQKVG